MTRGMETIGALGRTRAHFLDRTIKPSEDPTMRTVGHRGYLHLQRTVMFLVALTIQPQVIKPPIKVYFWTALKAPTLTFHCSTAACQQTVMDCLLVLIPHSMGSAPAWRCAHLLFLPSGDYPTIPLDNYSNLIAA